MEGKEGAEEVSAVGLEDFDHGCGWEKRIWRGWLIWD